MGEQVIYAGAYPAFMSEYCKNCKQLADELAALQEDSLRLDWMQRRLLAVYFDYGKLHETVLVIRWPGSAVGANIRTSIDAAREPK